MFSEQIAKIKTTPIVSLLKPGLYVDVHDNYGQWRNAKIKNIDTEISVSFDGWGSKYDESHRGNSSKVAYFKSHSEPYTGSQKQSMRDFVFQKEVDHIQQVIEKLSTLKTSDFKMEAPDLCQFIRGELFFLIDSILEERQLHPGEVRSAADLLEAFIRFFIAWVNHLKLHIYIPGHMAHSYLYYFNEDVGLVACFPDMFDTLLKILYGGFDRTKKFYQGCEQNLFRIYKIGDKSLQPYIGLFNYFKNEGGIEAIENLIKWEYKEENEVKYRTPFNIIKNLLPIIDQIYRSMGMVGTDQAKNDWLSKMKDLILFRLQNLTSHDYKDSTKDNSINACFEIFKIMHKHFQSIRNIQTEAEQALVKLSISLIKSSVMDKKIKGLQEISDIVNRQQSNSRYQNTMYGNTYQQNWVTTDTQIAKFLLEEKMFEIIISEASHSEVFKKSGPILRFLSESGYVRQEEIDQLWIAAMSRHEAEAQSIYEVINEMCKVLPQELIEYIYSLIQKIPQKEYDHHQIVFIREFCINISKSINNMQKKVKINPQYFLWELIQDKSQIQPQYMSLLLQGFQSNVKSERDYYQNMCLDNLRKLQSFPQSLFILQKIIESHGQSNLQWSYTSSEDILHKIMKEVPLIDLIVQSLEQYRASVSGPIEASQVVIGKLPHNLRIQYTIDFLDYIGCSNKKYEFSLENFRKLWQILIVSPVVDSDRQQLLELLNRGNFKFKEDLFKIIFSKLNYPIKQCYRSLEKYFYMVNIKNQSLIQVKSTIKVSKYDQIVGLDFIFEVAFQQDSDQAIQTLVNLHLRTEKVSQVDAKLYMWNQFLNRCKDGLRNPSYNLSNIIKCLKLLVTGVEGKIYLNSHNPESQQTKLTIQFGKDDKNAKEVFLPSNTTILGLRKHLNTLYNLKEQDFDFYFVYYDIKLIQESEEEYAVQIVEESRSKDKPDIIIQNLSNSTNPHYLGLRKFKTMLASNQDIAEILFELLQSENYDDIWEVLTIMPQNKQIKQQLEQGANNEEKWANILYFNCNKKLLYCLQIFEGMLQDKRQITDFVKNRGYKALAGYYLKRQENQFTNQFNLKCFAQVAKILGICQQNDTEIAKKALQYVIYSLVNKANQDTSSLISFIQQNLKISLIEPTIEYQIIIRSGLLENQDVNVRKIVCSSLLEINQLSKYFLDLVMQEDLRKIIGLKNQGEQFLDFFTGILLQSSNLELIETTAQLGDIILELVEQEDVEKILTSTLKLMSAVIAKCEASRTLVQTHDQLSEAIIEKCLFQLPSLRVQGARCSTAESRKAGFEVVQKLYTNSKLMMTFDQYIQYAYWRTPTNQNWNIAQTSQQKSRTGFVGLKNLGCICYMNSLMQQLFTLPHFRDCILQLNIDPKNQYVLYQFQLLLSALKNSQKQYYDPKPFCNVLGQDGQPINTMEQMDVDEFWMGLMDKLEKDLKPIQRDMIIQKSFGGMISNELICKGCPHRSSRDELFLALPLQVKNKKNIYDSLQTMTEGEMLEGENAYYCEKCEKRVTTLMRVCIKTLPNVLVTVLKRFEFNYENLQKFKLNDYYEFPSNLNMKNYTKEYFMKKESDNEEVIDLPEYPDEYYEFELKGVIVHSGTADSGHYISLIRDSTTQNWYEFNDTLVRPFDFNELANEAFGIDDKRSNNLITRSKNAYMVFYERKVYFDQNGKALKGEQDIKWFFNNNNIQKLKQNDEILQDNIKFQISQIMFEESFFEFSYNLIKASDQYPISRYCLQYFLVVIVRAQDRSNLPKYLNELRKIVRNNYKLSIEFLQSIQNRELLMELLIQNPIQDMKTLISGLLGQAVLCIVENEKNFLYNDWVKQSVMTSLIKSLLFYLWDLFSQARQCDQFYRLIYNVASSSENAKNYMSYHKTVGRLLLFFLEEPPIGAGYQDFQEPQQENLILRTDKTYIQFEIQQQQYQIARWDNTNQDYTYLVCTIAELMNNLDDDELQMFEDQILIKRLVSVSYTRQARNAVKSIFSQYIKKFSVEISDPWQATSLFVHSIYEIMKDCDEKDIKSCLVSLKGIADIEDGYEEQRHIMIAEALLLTLKDGLNYWHYTQIVFDYILKICSGIKFMNAMRQVLLNNKSVQKLIEGWCRDCNNPAQNFTQLRWKLFRKKHHQVQLQDINDKQQKFATLAQRRLEMLEKITKQQIYDSGYDSDEPMAEIRQNSSIDMVYPVRQYLQNYDNSGYQTWEVHQNIGDMIEIKNNQQTKWVYTTESSIAPAGSLTRKYENHVSFFR